MQELYQKVAELFCERIESIFETEATLEAEFHRNYEVLPFDRTNHWDGIFFNLLAECWLERGPEVKSEPTGYDRLSILKASHPLLDYNLFSQALLNLQNYNGMNYLTGDVEKELVRLQETWPKDRKLNPFAPKAKMVKQAEVTTEEQKQYNLMLSTLRALRIISQFTPQISFRVSPKKSTPAFSDSRNLSMIGDGGDKYLRVQPQLGIFYLLWDSVPRMATFVSSTAEGTEFKAPGISYPFISKSGGEALHTVLFARKILYEIFNSIDITKEICTMIPRMNSILVITDKDGVSLRKTVEDLKKHYPMLQMVEGLRQKINTNENLPFGGW